MKAVLALALLLVPVAGLPVRTAEQRQSLLDLAYLLGQAHALHRICAGPADNTWRGRMERLMEVEASNPAQNARLTERFNEGFDSREAQVRDCPAARAAEAALAAHGAALSRRLALVSP